MQSTVSSIIIHFNNVEFTRNVVRQLSGFTGPSSHEIIVVDNASEPPLAADAVPGARIVRIGENRGYGHACNRGADLASGSHLFILNNDLDFPENPLPSLLAAFDSREEGGRGHIGAVGPALQFEDGRPQRSWSNFPTLFAEFMERRRQEQSRNTSAIAAAGGAVTPSPNDRHVDWITGACMLVARDAWETVRGFDEAYFFYFEDVDLCTRLRRAGFATVFVPRTSVVHFGGGSDPLANPRIVLSYRQAQLRYYARYNSAMMFILLKLYLRRKFRRLARSGEITPELGAQVLETIRTFSRRDERRQFQEAERVHS